MLQMFFDEQEVTYTKMFVILHIEYIFNVFRKKPGLNSKGSVTQAFKLCF